MQREIPLVSIVVITYNSSKYLIETLESVKGQTYSNIELIVSDDCSSDETLELVEKFALNNAELFSRVEIIKSPKNTGIAANLNRGILASSGLYIKPIAGDDLLTSNCIQDFVLFFQESVEIQIAASRTKVFYQNNLMNFSVWPRIGEFPLSYERQMREILRANFVYNVSIFFTKNFFELIGGFEEKYPMIEDYPFDFKVLQSGFRFYFLDEITVCYRVNFDSTTRPLNQNKFVNIASHRQGAQFIRENILPELLSRKMYLFYFLRSSKLRLIDSIIANGNDINASNNKFNRKLLYLNKLISGRIRRFYNSIYLK